MVALFDYNKYNLLMESSFEFKGYDFLYFDEGVPYYSLFRSTRKLNSFWEIKYVAEVLIYMNPWITKDLFTHLMVKLTDRTSGHVIRTYSKIRIEILCDLLFETKHYNYQDTPYVRRYRKLIFNPSKMIPTEEKMVIVGTVIGSRKRNSKVTEEKLYQAIELLLDTSERITYVALAKELNCARQTISIHITNRLKDIINLNNALLRF